MTTSIAVGVDIGGTLTKVGLVDRKGDLHGHLDFKTTDYPQFDSYLDELHNKIEFLKKQLKTDFTIVAPDKRTDSFICSSRNSMLSKICLSHSASSTIK